VLEILGHKLPLLDGRHAVFNFLI